MIKKILSWQDVFKLLEPIRKELKPDDVIYGIPKGGMIVANFLDCKKTHDPEKCTIILDDIVDSGKTREKHRQKYPFKTFKTLIDKQLPNKGRA